MKHLIQWLSSGVTAGLLASIGCEPTPLPGRSDTASCGRRHDDNAPTGQLSAMTGTFADFALTDAVDGFAVSRGGQFSISFTQYTGACGYKAAGLLKLGPTKILTLVLDEAPVAGKTYVLRRSTPAAMSLGSAWVDFDNTYVSKGPPASGPAGACEHGDGYDVHLGLDGFDNGTLTVTAIDDARVVGSFQLKDYVKGSFDLPICPVAEPSNQTCCSP